MKEEKTGEESVERCSSPALGAVHCLMVQQRRPRASQQGSGFRNYESQFLLIHSGHFIFVYLDITFSICIDNVFFAAHFK